MGQVEIVWFKLSDEKNTSETIPSRGILKKNICLKSIR